MNPQPNVKELRFTARHFAFTSFKEPHIDESEFKNVRFIHFQKEKCPNTGKEHWQGYIQFNHPSRASAISKLLHVEGVHIEKAKGTPQQNLDYCSKERTRVNGVSYEYGTLCKSQGTRRDTENIYSKIIDKHKSIGSIARKGYITPTQLSYGLKLQQFTEPDWDRKPIIYWITGPAGAGKSRLAVDICGKNNNTYILSDNAKFWDGYIGQENIIVDDIKPNFFSIGYFLRLTDRYPFRVESKGSSIWFNGKIIVFTSIYSPLELFSYKTDEDQYQFMRRIRYTILPNFFETSE